MTSEGEVLTILGRAGVEVGLREAVRAAEHLGSGMMVLGRDAGGFYVRVVSPIPADVGEKYLTTYRPDFPWVASVRSLP
jgi:hypothetical protein